MARRTTHGTLGTGKAPGTGPRRSGLPRWLRFGPGLALALAAVGLAWPRLRDTIGDGRPRVERSRLASIPAPAPAPELGWVLEQNDALRLEPAQVVKLRRLKTRWERETGALREALGRASAQFDHDMASPGSGRSVQDLQERAAPVSDLSRQLADARRAYWSEASQVLTPAQRRGAEEAWTRHLAGGRQASPLPTD